MWKKLLIVLLLSATLTACHSGPHTAEEIPNLNPNNETGWTVLHGIYVKTSAGHDVLISEPADGEDLCIFMTFTEECGAPNHLQTGNKMAIKIVLVEESSGAAAAQVFAWAEYGDSPVSVDAEILANIENLSQTLATADAAEKAI